MFCLLYNGKFAELTKMQLLVCLDDFPRFCHLNFVFRIVNSPFVLLVLCNLILNTYI